MADEEGQIPNPVRDVQSQAAKSVIATAEKVAPRVAEGTLFIKRVSIKDFLTYQDFEMDVAATSNLSLNPGCNLILGKNGSGKSSFLNAIIYVLSDKFSSLTKNQKRGLLNNIAQQTSASQQRRNANSQASRKEVIDTNTYWVEVVLDNSQHRIPIQSNEIKLRKSYNCNTDREDYNINGQSISQKDLFNLFESGNFSLSSHNQFQIVAQGKVQQLVDKGESGFLEMLKEVTGTALFDQKIGNMMKSIDETKGKKEAFQQVLTQIKEKLQKLKDEIEVFNGYDATEKDKKALERCLYYQKVQLNQTQIENLRGQKQNLIQERENLLVQREEFLRQENIQDIDGENNTKIQILKEQIGGLENKIMSLQQVRQEIMNKQLTELESFGNMGGQQTTSLFGNNQRSILDYFGNQGAGPQNFQQQLNEISTNIESMKKDASSLDQTKTKLQTDIVQIQQKLGELEKQKDKLLLQREAAKNMSNPAKVNSFYKEEQKRLQVQNSQVAQDIASSTREQTNLKAHIIGLNKQLGTNTNEQSKNHKETREALIKIEDAKKVKRTIAEQVKIKIFEQNELDHEVKVQQSKISGYIKQIERVEPVFGVLQRIEQKCREQNITGYKGLLIDFIQCQSENFMPCIDVAVKSKLFAVIVDTLETAQQILQINKEMKGGVINIYPLETMSQISSQQKQIPSGVKSMLDIVQLNSQADPRLNTLIQNIFGKVVLVKSYEEGMQVAKQNQLTCITTDLQVVYSGAFISKVGHYDRNRMARFSIYQQIFKIKQIILNKKSQVSIIQSDRDKNDQMDLEALRDLQKTESSLTQLRSISQNLNQRELEFKSQIHHKTRNLNEVEKQIQNLQLQGEEFKARLAEVNEILKNPKKANKHQFNENDQRKLLQLNKKINELDLSSKDLQSQFIQVQNQIDQKNQLVHESYMPRQLQLKSLVMNQNDETAAQTDLSVGISKDQEFTNHLQNEKKQINQQLNELDQELRGKQEELNQQILMTQTQNGSPLGQQTQDELEHGFYSPGKDANLGQTQHGLIQNLRQKTQEVEELSMKIDELYQINNSLEGLMQKVQRYNQDLFKETREKMVNGQISWAELRNLIGDQNKLMESFPRQNKNCVEYYEKYYLKYEELDSKFTQQEKTEDQITKLLNSLRVKKAKSIEENFLLLSRNFSSIFKSIVQDGRAQLKLVKQQVDVSQQSEPTQFPEQGQTQQLSIGDNLYKGIRVLVSFTGSKLNEYENENEVITSQQDEESRKNNDSIEAFSLNHLSGGQKAVVAACLIFAIQKIEAAPFYIMDEFDSALDPQYCEGIAQQIKKLSHSHPDPITGDTCPGSQFIMTTFKPHLIANSDKIFEVTFKNQKSSINVIKEEKALKIIQKEEKKK